MLGSVSDRPFSSGSVFLSSYLLYVLNSIAFWPLRQSGLNILIGYTGQISLGHGAFFGVGAYAAAILATRLDVLLSFPYRRRETLRLSSHGFRHTFGTPQGSLPNDSNTGGQFIIEYVLIRWESLTREQWNYTAGGENYFPG
jgi:branched-chain amino acid transport system permease protein